MKQLSKNWLTENHIDLEYKQYLLMAYLKDVQEQFQQKFLYPTLAELIEHYRNLKIFRENAASLYQSFNETMEGFDFENVRISYRKNVNPDAVMEELSKIVDFSIPKFEENMNTGKEIYELMEKSVQLEPIGLTPLNVLEGYLMLETSAGKELRVYEYAVSVLEVSGEQMQAMRTEFYCSFSRSLAYSPESIKIELIKKNKKLPNPATFLISSRIEIPFEQTYFPIAKRLLMKEVHGSLRNS